MADLLTTTEAAAILGVSQSRVRQLILGGHLAAEKHGRDWMISPKVIEQELERRADETRDTPKRT